jgi:hypothetical protein
MELSASRCVPPRLLVVAGGGLAVLLAAAGCAGPTDVERPASLHGRVTLRGKPLADAMVYAVSEAVPTAPPASAPTGKNGSYSMAAVPAGRVRIAVVPAMIAGSPPPCDPRFLAWQTSGIAADLVAGDQPLNIVLE